MLATFAVGALFGVENISTSFFFLANRCDRDMMGLRLLGDGAITLGRVFLQQLGDDRALALGVVPANDIRGNNECFDVRDAIAISLDVVWDGDRFDLGLLAPR